LITHVKLFQLSAAQQRPTKLSAFNVGSSEKNSCRRDWKFAVSESPVFLIVFDFREIHEKRPVLITGTFFAKEGAWL